MIFKLLGALGMVLIIFGIINKNALRRNWLLTGGGILLLIYSIYLRDPIFIPLQAVFTMVSLYEIYQIKSLKH